MRRVSIRSLHTSAYVSIRLLARRARHIHARLDVPTFRRPLLQLSSHRAVYSADILKNKNPKKVVLSAVSKTNELNARGYHIQSVDLFTIRGKGKHGSLQILKT